MDQIKSKLIDFEYKLQYDPHDMEVIQQSDQFLKKLRELSNDMDTLIQYISTNGTKTQEDISMLHLANQTLSKLQYLDSKIVQLMNRNAKNQVNELNQNELGNHIATTIESQGTLGQSYGQNQQMLIQNQYQATGGIFVQDDVNQDGSRRNTFQSETSWGSLHSPYCWRIEAHL